MLPIPLRYHPENLAEFRRELERLALALDGNQRGEPNRLVPRWQPRTGRNLAFGAVVTVSPVADEEVAIGLPPATPADAGKECALIRANELGTVRAFAPGSEIDSRDSYRLDNEPGMLRFYCDGANYWSSRPGVIESTL